MKISDAKSLSAAIRERRKELKYTQAFLADLHDLAPVLSRIWNELNPQLR